MNLSYYLRGHLINAACGVFNFFPNSLRARNKKFKGIHKGQRCFILGSGHSILTQDLIKLKGEIVMTQNNFHAHKDTLIFNPKYHVVVPKYQPKEFDTDWNGWLSSMENSLPKDTEFFFGSNTKYLIDKRPLLKDRSFYVDTLFNPHCMNHAAIDITGWLMRVPTALPLCLAIALYMGFEKIYLLGFDLDQSCRRADRNNLRFYGNSEVTKNESEKEADLQFFSSGLDWFYMFTIWRELSLLKKAAKQRNVEIINATNGGLLDIFERKKYEELI